MEYSVVIIYMLVHNAARYAICPDTDVRHFN